MANCAKRMCNPESQLVKKGFLKKKSYHKKCAPGLEDIQKWPRLSVYLFCESK